MSRDRKSCMKIRLVLMERCDDVIYKYTMLYNDDAIECVVVVLLKLY